MKKLISIIIFALICICCEVQAQPSKAPKVSMETTLQKAFKTHRIYYIGKYSNVARWIVIDTKNKNAAPIYVETLGTKWAQISYKYVGELLK
mgnify:CR=1 FL=1